MTTVRVIGPGRAGSSLAGALARVGWRVVPAVHRGDPLAGAAAGVDLLVIATPDSAIVTVAAAVEPSPTTVVAHLSGALGTGVLDGHPRTAAIHPLVALPDPTTGVQRLLDDCTFAIDGDALAERVVEALGGRAVRVDDAMRPLYHATAVVAANHLVALAGQVERLATVVGVPPRAYWDLMSGALDDVRRVGPAAALTGPAARGDAATIEAHLAALPDDERPAYETLSHLARRLAGQRS